MAEASYGQRDERQSWEQKELASLGPLQPVLESEVTILIDRQGLLAAGIENSEAECKLSQEGEQALIVMSAPGSREAGVLSMSGIFHIPPLGNKHHGISPLCISPLWFYMEMESSLFVVGPLGLSST